MLIQFFYRLFRSVGGGAISVRFGYDDADERFIVCLQRFKRPAVAVPRRGEESRLHMPAREA